MTTIPMTYTTHPRFAYPEGMTPHEDDVIKVTYTYKRLETEGDVAKKTTLTFGTRDNYPEGDYSFTFGDNNVAAGKNSAAIGAGLKAHYDNQFVIGKNNEVTGALFTVGNGKTPYAPSNAFEVSSDGRIYSNWAQFANPLAIRSGGTGADTALGALQNIGTATVLSSSGAKTATAQTYICATMPSSLPAPPYTLIVTTGTNQGVWVDLG